MNEVIVGELYEHYKGNRYRVLAVGLDSETHEKMVVYQGQYDSEEFGNQPVWVRSYDVFCETVTVGAVPVPRFKHIAA